MSETKVLKQKQETEEPIEEPEEPPQPAPKFKKQLTQEQLDNLAKAREKARERKIELGQISNKAKALKEEKPITLNNSKYFIRNGSVIKTCTWLCGNVRLAPENINEQFNGVLKSFSSQNDTLGGVYPSIQSIGYYQDQFLRSYIIIKCIW